MSGGSIDLGAGVLAERLHHILDSIGEGLQILSPEWRYLYVNEAVCRHGKRRRDELVGRTMMEVYPGIEETEMFAALKRCMEDRRPHELLNAFEYSDGTQGWFDLRIQPCAEGLIVLSVDVTNQRKLEAQLRGAQKLDALGKLAGGVAHDFNNLLTAIKSFTLFAVEELPAESSARSDLGEVLEAARRAEALTKQLLTFARQQPLSTGIIEVNTAVVSVEGLLRRLLGEHIDIAVHLAPERWRTRIDVGGLEQVLMNLAVNARDAMPGGGKLTIETRALTLSEEQALGKGQLIAPGEYVLVAVSDTGAGMTPELIERIFEPFFTTKPLGQGTGLGLSICYGIVRQAGGTISVYSEPSQGTTFKIYLPRTLEDVGSAAPTVRNVRASGGERILVVEDDAQVREVATRALGRQGYQVLAASTVSEAFEQFERGGPELVLLITDVVMPDMNGQELSRQLCAKRPELRTLFISGYTEAAMVHRGTLQSGTVLLDKPFTPSELCARVRDVLDA